MSGSEELISTSARARAAVFGTEGERELFWFEEVRHTRMICIVALVSALINLTLCTFTAFVGIGWDWDVLLVELLMQASNGAIAACLHFRQRLLSHARSNEAVLVLVLSNVVLRVAVFWMFLDIALAPTDSNDGECKRMAANGALCAEYWYVYTKAVQNFATFSLMTMMLDTVLTCASTLNLRAVLRLEQHSDALKRVEQEQSDAPLIGGGEQDAELGLDGADDARGPSAGGVAVADDK